MMAKGHYDGKAKRTHNYKPYDPSNSFVKRVASKVSELLPQSLSRWLSTPQESDHIENNRFGPDEENGQRPSKRLRLDQSSNDYSHQNNIGQLGNPSLEEGDVSPILSAPLDDYARPGPSGLHLRKTDNFVASTPAVPPPITETPVIEKINEAGDDGSDSSDSTSGCSSLVPQSDKVASFSSFRTLRTTETPNLSSPAGISRNSRNILSKSKYPRVDFSNSSSVGMPVFDPVVFQSPFRNRSLNASLKEEISNASPFYRGRTMYGGASSCREALLGSSFSRAEASPRIINIKPEQSLTVRDSMGDTAKKILEALQKFSTPVIDAKRIPVRQSTPTGQKRKLPQPYQELSIPKMPDLLRIKRREAQNRRTSFEASQPSASGSGTTTTPALVTTPHREPSPYKKQEEKPSRDEAVRGGDSQASSQKPTNLEPKAETSTPSGFFGSSSVFTSNLGSPPRLNSGIATLPIKSLPVIDIPVSKPPSVAPSSTVPSSSPKPKSSVTVQHPTSSTSTSCHSFKFSEPISQPTNIPTPVAVSQSTTSFKFSIPLDPKEDKKSLPQNKSMKPLFSGDATSPVNNSNPTNVLSTIMKTGTSNFKLKRKTPAKSTEIEPVSLSSPANELKSGSVMDFLSSNAFTSSSKTVPETHKCKKCNVNIEKNKVLCGVCENASASDSKKDTNDKSDTVVKESEHWNCKKCSQTVKGSTCLKCELNKDEKTEDKKREDTKLKGGFESFYKPPTDTWECKECFVRNKLSDAKCVACSNPNPNPPKEAAATKPLPKLNALFKKEEGSWECGTCLVSNKTGTDACVACGTLKPGATAAPKEVPKPTFSFGIPQSVSVSEGKNKEAAPTFLFGANNELTKPSAPKFSFGINCTEAKTEKSDSTPIFKFGSTDKTETNKLTFTFGATESKEKKEPEVSTTVPTSAPSVGFSFGSSSSLRDSKVAPEEKEDHPPKKRVSFGNPLTEERTIAPESSAHSNFSLNNATSKNETTSAPFSFQVSAPKEFFSTKGEGSDSQKPGLFEITIPNSTSGTSNKVDKTFSLLSENQPKPETNVDMFNAGSKDDLDSVGKSLAPKKNNLFGESNSNLFVFGNGGEKKNFCGTNKSSGFFNSDVGSENKVFNAGQSDTWNAKPNFPAGSEGAAPFGSTSATTTFSGFGAPSQTFPVNNSEASHAQPFTFNSLPSQQAANTSGFPFKTETEVKPQAFSFTAPATTQSTGGFNFPVPQTTTANSFEAPAFNPQTTTANSFVAPAFNPLPQQPSAPIFGGGVNTNFGAPPGSAPQPTFQFGAQPQPEQPSAPLFSFNAQAQAAPAPTPPSFSFGSQNAVGASATPSFDPNIKPIFNFTGGATPSFSAQLPTGTPDGKPERKIRRAVRRNPR